MSEACAFDTLPPAVHLSIALLLSFVERVRCSLVSRRWRSLLAEPAFWAELSRAQPRSALTPTRSFRSASGLAAP